MDSRPGRRQEGGSSQEPGLLGEQTGMVTTQQRAVEVKRPAHGQPRDRWPVPATPRTNRTDRKRAAG